MADRKPFIGNIKTDEELKGLLEASRKISVTNDELMEANQLRIRQRPR